jgi:quinoprotein glucose dehydrogenase
MAIDLRDGVKKWETPLGKTTLPNGQTVEGIVNFGGSLVTAGDLVFIAATIRDDALRAFDVDSGRLLWESHLPASAQASPMTYRWRGRQYVVICAGGHGKNRSTMGDSVVAYALP